MSVWAKGALGKFIRYEAKGLARKLGTIWAKSIIPPTRENTRFKSSHIWVDIRDEFLAKDMQQENDILLLGAFNQLIIINDFDIAWRERIKWLVKRIREADWPDDEGEDVPRYQWWLDKPDSPKHVTLEMMIQLERWFAYQVRDGLSMARHQVMLNLLRGLSKGENVDPVLFTENYGKIAFKGDNWEVGNAV